MPERREPWVELGDGVTATASELLVRCVQRGGPAAFHDVVDDLIVERGGRLSLRRRLRRWFRHTFRGAARAGEPAAPAIPLVEPRVLRGSEGAVYAAWVGEGAAGYVHTDGARPALAAWASLEDSRPRRIALPGIMTSRPEPSPRGSHLSLHVLYDGQPSGGWSNESAGCLILELATGALRVLVESTPRFELWDCELWSPDGARLVVGGLDRRGPPPLSSAIHVLDAATGRTLAALERRDHVRPLRFEGDDLLVEIGSTQHRWRPGASEPAALGGGRAPLVSTRYILPSGAEAYVLDEHRDGRLLLRYDGQLAWSRRRSG